MSSWSEAFNAAATGDYTPLASVVSERVGRPVEATWLASRVDDALGLIMLYAPCKRGEWVSCANWPATVQTVVGAALSRSAANPDGIRTVQMGEYSQTWAGNLTGSDELFSPVEKRVIAVASGCGESGLQSVRATVDPPIPGIPAPTTDLVWDVWSRDR